MEGSEIRWVASDGTEMFAREWNGKPPERAAVCLVHGFGDHSGRYASLAESFAAAGISVLAYDGRGHGRSKGRRGDMPSYDTMLDDLESALALTRSRHPGVPIFLYGHSTGGGLVLNAAIRRKPEVAGVIASSPWLRLAFAPPKWKEVLGRWLLRLAPGMPINANLDIRALTRDTGKMLTIRKDPLTVKGITPRMYFAMVQAGEWALAHADELELPLLLQHGTADRITSIEASERFADRAEHVCTFRVCIGYYHEIHLEPQNDEVVSYMTSWIRMMVDSPEPVRTAAESGR